MITLEVCCDSINAAINAQKGKAQRVELCRDLSIGGVTPPEDEIKAARLIPDITLNVLIRPRGGNFVYSKEEVAKMIEEIRFCGQQKCDGVVIGALLADGDVDKTTCKELIAVARSYAMSITFHRAIDRSKDIIKAMEACIELGCDRILTSGGKPSAFDGIETLKLMVKEAGSRIIIMPGAGVTPYNIRQLVDETGCSEVHGSFQGSLKKIKQAINLLQL